MTEAGDDFRQHGVRDRLAVSDDAVEVKNQCTHYFNSGEDQRVACLICGPAPKWTDATESSRTLSVAWCVDQAPPVSPPSPPTTFIRTHGWRRLSGARRIRIQDAAWWVRTGSTPACHSSRQKY